MSNSVEFGITYKSKKGISSFIHISEAGREIEYAPSTNTSVFLDISGIKVLEEEAEQIIPSKSNKDSQIIKGYYYGWYNKEASIEVDIYGYDKVECRKIIESMIR